MFHIGLVWFTGVITAGIIFLLRLEPDDAGDTDGAEDDVEYYDYDEDDEDNERIAKWEDTGRED